MPLVYALTGDMKGDTYSHVIGVIKYFVEVKLKLGPMNYGSVLIDFEKAAMNAFEDVLPGYIVRNCFFHLCQSCQKKIQEKFKIKYFSDKSFAIASRLVVFLAFVPIADIDDAFYEVTYYIQSTYPQLMFVLNYFENTYLGGVSVDHEERILPRFPSRFWNHFDAILYDPNFPRTSNMVEGFHRGFRTRVHRPKPSVQEYFRAIDQQQVMTDYHLDRLVGGKTPSKRRRMNNHELYDICKSYSTFSSKLEYLIAVAKCFMKKKPASGTSSASVTGCATASCMIGRYY